MATFTGISLLMLLLLLLGRPGPGTMGQAVVCGGTACYTAHWGKLSADEAQLSCQTNGGNLATVRSAEEAQHIQEALGRLLQSEESLTARTGKFWIGLQRERGRCLDQNLTLKGFSWIGGGDDTPYANWQKELKNTCLSKRCVSLMLDLSPLPPTSQLSKWAEGPCGSPGSPGRKTEGFVCKFSFKGMCWPLALGGPGQVIYNTPFQVTSSSLEAVPFGSMATVTCGDEGKDGSNYFLCKEKDANVFNWGTSGPLCVISELGCSFNNGGCQQDCFEGGEGSFHCGCRPGFRLLDDLVTCASRNPCGSSPCKGEAVCKPDPLWKSYTCHCPAGYQLDLNMLDCNDIDECQAFPCTQECINTPGSYLCACWIGYEPAEGTCQDLDECAPGQNPCAQVCTNTNGSFHCSCEVGYTVVGEDGTQCQDVDECIDQGSSPCKGLCFNVPGSFHCGCLPGWELAPNGSCIPGHISPGQSTEVPESPGGDQGRITPSAVMPTPPRGTEAISEEASTSLTSSILITRAPPKILVSNGSSNIRVEPSTSHPMTSAGHAESADEDLMAKQNEDSTNGQKLLLFYILGTVMAILLLLALALGLLVYRKQKAKRMEKKEEKTLSASDSYSWVPERADSKAMENGYSPSPGTDC